MNRRITVFAAPMFGAALHGAAPVMPHIHSPREYASLPLQRQGQNTPSLSLLFDRPIGVLLYDPAS